jgi:arylsulfatase
VLSIAILSGLASCSAGYDAPRPEGPAKRVILITCDTLRADHLGVYGYQRPTSPALDAFAAECVVFDDCSATSSITGPSLSAIMTGLYPDELGTFLNHFQMPPEAVTIAELAREAGYRTAGVVSNPVLKHYPALGEIGVRQGFQHWDDEMNVAEENRPHLKERLAPDTAAAAIRWLERQRATGDDGFFLWVHFQDPHGPYTPPEEFASLFETHYETDVRIPIGKTRFGRGQIPKYQALGGEQAPVLHPAVYRDRYDAEIRFFDTAFGELVGWLREADWLDESLVVMTADHGEALGENGYWFSHGENVYRGVIHVPLLVRYPKGAARPSGNRVATCVNHLDLWPTFQEALGLEPLANRGTSLLTETVPTGRTFLSMVRPPNGVLGADVPDDPRRWEAVSSCTHRMLYPPGRSTKPQLYDIAADPTEQNNLIDSRPGPAVGLLQSYKECRATFRAPMTPVLVDFKSQAIQAQIGEDAAREALKALQGTGYVEGDEDEEDE